MQFSRRAFLRLVAAGGASLLGLSSYAFAIEPRFRLTVTPYRLTPPGWPKDGRKLRIAALADIHACDPWMPVERIDEIVAVTNELKPDIVVLLGDFVTGMRRYTTGVVPPSAWAASLAKLSAPLGAFAVLGNHDWWNDVKAVRAALVDNGMPVLENQARLLGGNGLPEFWLAGLGDQWAGLGHGHYGGVDDLPGTLAAIPHDGKPILMLAHEPDIFAKMPARVSLTLSGHTHGGQVRLPLIGTPVVPSRYGSRFAYGHIVEEERHLIVSGGLGCSGIPVRFGVPPEIVMIELGGDGGSPSV